MSRKGVDKKGVDKKRVKEREKRVREDVSDDNTWVVIYDRRRRNDRPMIRIRLIMTGRWYIFRDDVSFTVLIYAYVM